MMAIDAMLVAMYVVLKSFSIRALNFSFTFDSFPIIVGAVLFGPIHGGIIGFLGGCMYQFFFSGYGITLTTPLWIIPAVARGLIVGFYSKRCGLEPPVRGLIAVNIIAGVIVTALNTLAIYTDSRIFNYFSYELVFGALIPRIISGVTVSTVFALIVPAVVRGIRKNIKLSVS